MNRDFDARHALWLTAAVALVGAPHAQRLPWWLSGLAATLIVWRAYVARAKTRLPPRFVLVTIVVAASAGVYFQYRSLFGRDAGVALLVVMLGLKLLEMNNRRDALLLVFLSYFLVITNFLYSQTIPTALYMLVCVWFITGGMIGINYTRPPKSVFPQLRTSAVLLAQAAPLMLVLFVLFPRVQGPLWGMPAEGARASTGLSDTMAPGSVTNVALSDAVAFRVAFKSPMPEAKRLYWRGPVLWDYDGRTWRAPQRRYTRLSYNAEDRPVDYTVTLEPSGKPWLFALDLPARLPPRTFATIDFQLVSPRPITTRVRYDMRSYLEYKYGLDAPQENLERALELPEGYNPRTLALARELKARYRSDRAIVDAAYAMFARERFVYTLSPPPLGANMVDEFLFDTKAGFCEHYSSAFAVLMRAAGIPALVVTGYLGGEANPIGDYLIVRQADAHAWTEVWLRGSGWVRVDPTAAVSPARIERGISAADATGDLPLFIRSDNAVMRQLRLTWDSLANSWNQWVLGYTPERQRALLTRVGLDDATWRTLAALLLAGTGAVILAVAFFTLRRLRVSVDDPVLRTWIAFCRKLASKGLARDPAEGPLAYAARIARSRPELASAVHEFVALYVRLRYAGEARTENVAKLKKLAHDFRA
jgi:transglutaminase-like putative cysteine protease